MNPDTPPQPAADAPNPLLRLSPAARRRAWPLRLSDVRGAARLAVEATLGVTDVVEQLHHTILRRAAPVALRPVAAPGPTGGITGLAYRSVRGVTRGVGQGLDLLLGPAAQRLLDSLPVRQGTLGGPEAIDEIDSLPRQAVLAAMNGVLGDHLHDSGNPLALPMVLRQQGRVLALPGAQPAAASHHARPLAGLQRPRPRVLLMVHGLCMNPWQWQPQREAGVAAAPDSAPDTAATVDLGAALAADGDLCLLHLHYNTGLPVATNGRLLADRLQALQQHWPVPLQELVLVGHSMGGLVARSACQVAQTRGDAWLPRLGTLVCLGTPHHGAPLERGGRGVDLLLGISPYTAAFARLGQVRSAGITDLRHGSVQPATMAGGGAEAADAPGPQADPASVDADGNASAGRRAGADPRPPTPLPAHVRCFAVAGQVRDGPLTRRLGPQARAWLGDGLVPVDSALGQHAQPEHCLAFPPAHRWVAEGLDHLALMNRPEVLAQLRRWQVAAPSDASQRLGQSLREPEKDADD